MKLVKVGETQQETYKNCNIHAATAMITMKMPIGNTPYLSLFTENIIVKGILHRNRKDETLFNEPLRNLIYLSEFDTPLFGLLTGALPPPTLVASDGTNLTCGFPLKFDFGGILNLDGNDSFTLQVAMNPGCFHSSIVINESFLQFDVIEGIGLETETPYIKSRVIEANQNNPTFDLGDNIKEILLANFDKTNYLLANSVLNNLSVTSDKWSRDDSYLEMICRNFAQFEEGTNAYSRYQNFRIYVGEELDSVRINLSLNSANVAPSKNAILYYQMETNDALVTKAGMKRKKFNALAQSKAKFNPSLIGTV